MLVTITCPPPPNLAILKLHFDDSASPATRIHSFNKTTSNELLKMNEHRELNFLWFAFQNFRMYFTRSATALSVCLFVHLFLLWTGIHDTCLLDFHPFSE